MIRISMNMLRGRGCCPPGSPVGPCYASPVSHQQPTWCLGQGQAPLGRHSPIPKYVSCDEPSWDHAEATMGRYSYIGDADE
jgi:hypothetical protein